MTLYESPRLTILPQRSDRLEFANFGELLDDVQLHGYYGGIRLIKAAIKRFGDYCATVGAPVNRNFSIEYHTDIPIRVGLAGSSAIVTATMRGLMQFFGVEIPKPLLPGIILSVELDELKIGAGLQDRVIQVYGGSVFMDFDKERMARDGYGLYEPLDPRLLPPLYVAYHDTLAEGTEVTHNDLRSRYNRGEEAVHAGIKRWAELTQQARDLILAGRGREIGPLMDANFDLRASLIHISPGNRALVETGQEAWRGGQLRWFGRRRGRKLRRRPGAPAAAGRGLPGTGREADHSADRLRRKAGPVPHAERNKPHGTVRASPRPPPIDLECERPSSPPPVWVHGFYRRRSPCPRRCCPIVDTPVLQFVIEEAVASGIDDILIVTGRGKRAIENHFDFNPELEAFLAEAGKRELIEQVRDIGDRARIHYIRQKQQLGLGDAIRLGRDHVGRPAVRRPARRHDHRSARGAKTRPTATPGRLRREAGQWGGGASRPPGMGEAVRDRGRRTRGGQSRRARLRQLVEKPSVDRGAQQPGHRRSVRLHAGDLRLHRRHRPGVGGEIQLTDAMNLLAQRQPMYALSWQAKRYDIGNRVEYAKCFIDFALRRPETANAVREHLRTVLRDR